MGQVSTGVWRLYNYPVPFSTGLYDSSAPVSQFSTSLQCHECGWQSYP